MTADEMRMSDWSSDVCSSELPFFVRFGVVSGRSSPLGEGDHAKHGGGAREVFPALSASQDSARAPPPPYGWSPSPGRGGPATTGRLREWGHIRKVEGW